MHALPAPHLKSPLMKTFAALVLTFALVAYAAAAPLHDAAKQGNTKAIVALLDVGADPNERDTDHASPLHWAANRGHTEAIVCWWLWKCAVIWRTALVN